MVHQEHNGGIRITFYFIFNFFYLCGKKHKLYYLNGDVQVKWTRSLLALGYVKNKTQTTLKSIHQETKVNVQVNTPIHPEIKMDYTKKKMDALSCLYGIPKATGKLPTDNIRC